MKVIIAICAPERTGKSSALLSFYNAGFVHKPTIVHPKRQKIRYDVAAWGYYKFSNGQVSSKLVGINSKGDRAIDISTNLNQLILHGCEVIVTACRNEDTASFKQVETLASANGYELITTMHYSHFQKPRVSQHLQTGTPYIMNGVNLQQLFVSHLWALIDHLI